MLKSLLTATVLTHQIFADNEYHNEYDEPICDGMLEGTPFQNQDLSVPSLSEYNEALKDLDIHSVLEDIRKMLNQSKECWPADSFHGEQSYGPLMVRLAWHCSGTFRATDGMGGCSGGRQRFFPESSWEDNTNLDKARALLTPIKRKYGASLSWGDLMVFAGTASILEMEGPITEVCAGRIDEPDGTKSLSLNQHKKCEKDPENCPEPIGAEHIGLIYVNPEGFRGIPEPEQSEQSAQIRRIFGRMAMNDRETVALIGGGHAFGKAHGACPFGAGSDPLECPFNPWPGKCDQNTNDRKGRGRNTFTSGIEGIWTFNPLKWNNQFFTLLNEDGMNYTLIEGIGGKHQWQHPKFKNLMMLTSDLALIYDPIYDEIVDEFANDIDALNFEFAHAWAKLTTNGGGWAQNRKCVQINQLLGPNGERIYKEENDDEQEKGKWFWQI